MKPINSCHDGTKPRSARIYTTISALLERAEIAPKVVNQLLTTDTIQAFDQALTHESVNQHKNYNLFEFVGDNMINLIVAEYVVEHFDLELAGQATIIKHKIQSNKFLGELADKHGLYQHLLIVPSPKDNEVKIKGDVMEAVIGCLYMRAKQIRMKSTAFLICDRVVRVLLKEMKLETIIDPTNCKDPVTIFKEQYHDHYDGWGPMSGLIKTIKLVDGKIKAMVMGVPNDRVGKKVLLAEVVSETASDAKALAASRAIQILQNRYGVMGKSGKKFIPNLPGPGQINSFSSFQASKKAVLLESPFVPPLTLPTTKLGQTKKVPRSSLSERSFFGTNHRPARRQLTKTRSCDSFEKTVPRKSRVEFEERGPETGDSLEKGGPETNQWNVVAEKKKSPGALGAQKGSSHEEKIPNRLGKKVQRGPFGFCRPSSVVGSSRVAPSKKDTAISFEPSTKNQSRDPPKTRGEEKIQKFGGVQSQRL